MTDTYQHEAIHTRLNYMEEKFESKLGDMAESISKMADGVDKIAQSVSDISLLTDRSNQHAARLDALDRRVDAIEEKIPVYDIVTGAAKRIGLVVLSLLAAAIFGGVIVSL